MTVQQLVNDFVRQLTDAIESTAAQRAGDFLDEMIARRFPARRSNGAPSGRAPDPRRRKGPIQLCPVPGCKERAAPVFGMVCAGHKDVPKAKIAAYRAARRAGKAAA